MNTEKIAVLETVVDHLTGEEMGNAIARLNEMVEVLDAIVLPGLGKKNRPVHFFQLLCKPEDVPMVRDAIFRHTHALGVRFHLMERFVLPRRQGETIIEGVAIPAKIHEIDGEEYVRPEADGLAEMAKSRATGMPSLRFDKLADQKIGSSAPCKDAF